MADTREEGPHVPDGPTEVLTIPGHESRDYRPMRQPPTNETHELWVRRTKELIPKAEGEIYKRWLATQPSTVERVPYTTPTKILRRPSESSEGSVSDRDDQAECATTTTEPSTEMVAEVEQQEEARPKLTAHSDRVLEGSEVAQLKLEGAYLAAATVSEDWGDRDDPITSEHPGNAIELEDYAHELAFLPDLTEAASTTLDYTGPHVQHPSLSVEQQDRVVKIKNAPMIYQRKIDNALWGFVQPRGGWSAFAERVQTAEAADTAVGGSPTDTVTHNRTRFEADRESSDIPDSLSAVVYDPRDDMFVSGEADQSSLVPVLNEGRSLMTYVSAERHLTPASRREIDY
ncbi:unnamed protein product [Phytophthora fragariaefolia]|uniref:Unnamed protein product n=1 Tax=Phytophthora fragariaefolia TaxID=1490495 RepID=A0A9W7CXU5_9STRA|nr:unnamed protein product [Phytophthora fragariaefolia]